MSNPSSIPERSVQYTLYSNRDLLNLIIPIIIEQVLFMAVGTIDTIMVASLGDAAVSGVSIVDMINNVVGSSYFALATGGAVVAAQFLGARNPERARTSAKQLIFVVFTFATLFCVACEVLNHRLLTLFYGNLEPDVMSSATVYFRYTAFTYPIIGVYCSCTSLLRAMNQSRHSMYASAVTNLLNCAGNYLLIFVFPLGVKGAAISTLASRCISMLFVMWLLTNPERPIHIVLREKFRPNWDLIRKILHIGIPNGIENCIFNFGRVLVVGVIATFGKAELAANAVANSLDAISILSGAGFGLAMITVIGQAVGAADEGQCRFYIRKMMRWCYTANAFNALLVISTLPLTLRCFSELTPEATSLARSLVLIRALAGFFPWPTSFPFAKVHRAANDVRFTMLTSIGSMLLVRVGLAYAIAHFFHLGALGVWFAMVTDWCVRISFFLWRYLSGRWKTYANFQTIGE